MARIVTTTYRYTRPPSHLTVPRLVYGKRAPDVIDVDHRTVRRDQRRPAQRRIALRSLGQNPSARDWWTPPGPACRETSTHR